ncbi:MAG TPA: hypothetical protein VK668_09490 [Mucilaginibacter sp.]|nr:hypothetical protein [Mucilaginibacter sp.]
MIHSSKKSRFGRRLKNVLMILVSFLLVLFSLSAFPQNDTPKRRAKTVKEVWDKINPFKKKKKKTETEEVKPPDPAPPPPKPSVTTTKRKTTTTKKKSKKIIDPKTNKPTQPLI